MSHSADGAEAPAPARNKTSDEFLRALRRRGQRFRKAEAARISAKQFRIRCERAALLIAKKGIDTRVACRAVGFGESSKAQEVVKALCDERKIPRRFFWGFPRWQTQMSTSVSVMPNRKEVVRRDDDAIVETTLLGEKK